jgi:hypothetical protein
MLAAVQIVPLMAAIATLLAPTAVAVVEAALLSPLANDPEYWQ